MRVGIHFQHYFFTIYYIFSFLQPYFFYFKYLFIFRLLYYNFLNYICIIYIKGFIMTYFSCSQLLSYCAPCFFKKQNSSTNSSLSQPFIDRDILSDISSNRDALLSSRNLKIIPFPEKSVYRNSDSQSSLDSIKEET